MSNILMSHVYDVYIYVKHCNDVYLWTMDIWAQISIDTGHLSDNISGHLSDTISIDPKIYVDNWTTLTTSTCTHL